MDDDLEVDGYREYQLPIGETIRRLTPGTLCKPCTAQFVWLCEVTRAGAEREREQRERRGGERSTGPEGGVCVCVCVCVCHAYKQGCRLVALPDRGNHQLSLLVHK